MLNLADLPDDITALKALLVTSEGRNVRKQDRIDQLEKLVADFKRALFGARSEKTDPEQFELALDEIETAMAVVHAEDEALDRPASRAAKPRNTNRGSLPKHLPRIEEVIEPGLRLCSCGAERHMISEDTSERLDFIPAQFRVIVDLSRFDAASLIAFTATKETNYGTETDGRIPQGCGADRADQRAYT